MNIYGTDCVGSLIACAGDGSRSFRERNRAVWALGQIADKRALPFLEKLGENAADDPPCSLDKCISSHEVNKAVKWCTRGNATSWMYRHREEWK